MLRLLVILLTTAALATPGGVVVPAPVRVGDVEVAITHLVRDADDHFAAHGNDEPEAGRAYAVIGLAIENVGEEPISSRDVHLVPFVDGVEVRGWMCPTVVNGTIANERIEIKPGARAEVDVCALLPEGELALEAFVNGADRVALPLPEPVEATPMASPQA